MVSLVTEELILNVLRSAETSLTILEIAKRGNLHRVTAAKYLEVLEAKGYVKHRPVGKAKLYMISDRNEFQAQNQA